MICLSQPDTALVTRCQDKDIAAFDEIVARYKHKIFNYIYRMVGDSEEAEDLTQEVFVKTYVSLGSFRSQASLNTWLYRIAGNPCIDSHRKRTRRQNALGGSLVSLSEPATADAEIGEDSGPARDVPDSSMEPYVVLARKDLDERAHLALQSLPEKMRRVIVLHDLEDVPYEEIASILGIPLGTVKSRLFNARMQLRDLLRPYVEA